MNRNIVLIGFMGAGKSLISKSLAMKLRRPVVSTDQKIVEKEKRTINEIFEQSGEQYFRQIEKDVVARLAGEENLIIDGGGGIVLDPQNITFLKANGILFYLFATPQEIYRRTQREAHRPLLQVKDPLRRIEELFGRRESFYAQADYTIDTNQKSPDLIRDEIITLFNAAPPVRFQQEE